MTTLPATPSSFSAPGKTRVVRLLGYLLACATVLYAVVTSVRFTYSGAPRHRAEAAWWIAAAIVLLFMTMTAKADRPVASSSTGGGNRADLWIGCAFAVLAFVLYRPALDVALLSDDYVLLERAGRVDFSMGGEFFRPFPLLVLAIAAQIGFSAVLLHALTITVHAANSWLVFLLAQELGFSRLAAVSAGGLFLTAASSVETVAWVSALFDGWMVLGALLYAYACLRGWMLVSFGAIAVSLLSKETGVVAAPLALALCALARRPLRLPVVGLAVTVGFVAYRLALLPPPQSYAAEPSRYLVKELVTRAFAGLAFPWHSNVLSQLLPLALLPWLAVAALIIFRLTCRLHAGGVAAAVVFLFWIVASVAPVYSYFYVAPTLEGSRYLYLGSAGFALLAAHLAFGRNGAPRIGTVAASGLMLAMICAGAWGVRVHLRPWLTATSHVDEILAAAPALARADCDTISVAGLPDSIDGAYVFRNGFVEALTIRGVRLPPVASHDAECVYRWTGTTFTVIR